MYIGSRVIRVTRINSQSLKALQSNGFTVILVNSPYAKVSATQFHRALAAAKSLGGIFDSVHLYSANEYSAMTCYLSSDSKSGYALKGSELVSVFSTVNGRGAVLVRHAIANGASHLDAFDGYLSKFYSKLGFREYKRESNWVKDGPDVVFFKIVE